MPPSNSDHEREKIERLRRAMYSRDLADRLEGRPRHELDEEANTVGEEWKNEPAPQEHVGSLAISPAVSMQIRRVLKWILITAGVFCIAALGFLIYTFTLGAHSIFSSSNNISIVVSGPPEVTSGSQTQIQIAITNKNTAQIELAELVITYPDGTRTTAVPNATSCNSMEVDMDTGVVRSERICLGTIAGGATQQGTIRPIFAGASLSRAKMKVELQYHLSGSNAVFTAATDYEVVFKTSSLSLSITGNHETISGQPLQFTAAVTSNATTLQKGVMLHVDYPFGFTFRSSAPAQSSPGNWYIGDLQPGETKTFQLSGTMTGQPGEQRVFRLSAGTRDPQNTAVLGATLAEESQSVKISDSFLGLAIHVNADSTDEQDSTFSKALPATPFATPGSTVSVTIRYTNNLSSKISNAVIAAKLSGVLVDGTAVRVADGIYRSSDNVVYWDQTTSRGRLGEIEPGASGSLTFSFRVPDSAPAGSSGIEISVNAAGKRLDQSGVPQSLQSVASQKILIASNLAFTAQGLYYQNSLKENGDLGDLGPIPPKAEAETTYAILFSVTNTNNKITGAKLTARMPPYVRWLNVYGPKQERISVSQTDSTVTWDLGDIAPNVGVNGSQPRQAEIAIAFAPSTAQIGQQPILMQDIVLTGTDSTTGQVVTLTATPNITTNLFQVAKSSSEVNAPSDTGFSSSDATVVK